MESKLETPFRMVREERNNKDDKIHKENKIIYPHMILEMWHTPPFKYQNLLLDGVWVHLKD